MKTLILIFFAAMLMSSSITVDAHEDHDWTNPSYQARIRSDIILYNSKLLHYYISKKDYNKAKKCIKKIINNSVHIKKMYRYGF